LVLQKRVEKKFIPAVFDGMSGVTTHYLYEDVKPELLRFEDIQGIPVINEDG
jgi:hypothetical protein